jgi:hypothetical protein
MLRIERITNGQVVFTLSGRMQTEGIEQLQQLLVVETPGQPLMLDLRNVTLVNQDAVTFLADCEAKGIEIESCPLHIRTWIDQEKRRNRRRRQKKGYALTDSTAPDWARHCLTRFRAEPSSSQRMLEAILVDVKRPNFRFQGGPRDP